MAKFDIYQSVTDSIIEAIESGNTGRFEMPWHGVSTMPLNARTENLYHGVNVPLLWVYQIKAGYRTAKWATYKQWQELKCQVRKGEKGVPVVFWKEIEVEPSEDNEEAEKRMFARYSVVFNADQVDGYDFGEQIEPSNIISIAAADTLIDATGADIRHTEARAYYDIEGDYINLPCPEIFKQTKASTATENYYSTLFHELTHWSGAAHRLNRFSNERNSDASYAFEELVAELGSAFLCAHTGVESSPRNDHACYLKCWLKALKNDKRFIFAASSQAQKATDYLYYSFEEQKEGAA